MDSSPFSVYGMQGVRVTPEKDGVLRMEQLVEAPLGADLRGPNPNAWAGFSDALNLRSSEQNLWLLPDTRRGLSWALDKLAAEPSTLVRLVEQACGEFSGIRGVWESALGSKLRNWNEFRAASVEDHLAMLWCRAKGQNPVGGKLSLERGMRLVLYAHGPFRDRGLSEGAISSFLEAWPSPGASAPCHYALGEEVLDLVWPDLSQRLILTQLDGLYYGLLVRSASRSKTELVEVAPARVRLFRYDSWELLRVWLTAQAPCEVAELIKGQLLALADRSTLLVHPLPITAQAMGLPAMKLPSVGLQPLQTTLSVHHPPMRVRERERTRERDGSDFSPGSAPTLQTRTSLSYDEEQLRGRAQALGVKLEALGGEDELLPAIARACAQAMPLSRLTDGRAVFARRWRGDALSVGGDLLGMESIICHATPQGVLHPGLPARPNRLRLTQHGQELFVPANPFAE